MSLVSAIVRRASPVAVCLALTVAFAPRIALAQSNNDAEVQTLIDSVFESEYAQKNYVDALEKLQLASTVCQEGACSSKVRAKVLVAVGTVLADGLDQAKDAKEVFKTALKEDPNATLIKGHDTGKVKEAWEAAGGKSSGAPVTSTRKKFPGSGKTPSGWKSAEAYWYYDQAKQADTAKNYEDCAGYASDSLAVEDRLGTKFLRAQCNEKGGKLAAALTDFKVVAETGADAGMKDAAKTSSERVKDLDGRVPKLTLKAPAKTDGLTVKIDEQEIANDQLDGELRVDAGSHKIVATATQDGADLEFEKELSLSEGASETVEIKLAPKQSVFDESAVMQCMRQAKSKDDLAKCIGDDSPKTPINVVITSEVAAYHDDDHVDVVTPSIGLSISGPTGGWEVDGSFLVDVVTAASTDIVATASPRWTEVRYVPAIGGSKKFGDATLGLSANASVEPDYISASGGLNFSVDLKQKTITPTLGYEFSYDLSGRAGTQWSTYSRPIIRNAITAGVGLVLDKASTLSLGTTLIFENGDSSKPYRYIPMFKPGDVPAVQPGLTIDAVNQYREPEKVLEQLPTDRQRFALAARFAHRFTTFTFRGEERLYIDTWGLKASTTDITFPIDFGDHVRLWPHFRGHFQTGADFWALAYPATVTPAGVTVPALRTGDRELGPLIGLTGGVGSRFMFGADNTFAITLAGDVLYTRFLDHLFILQRLGFFGALGAELAFE
ncbi:MAG: DUF3570 domain-containing protein [Polyangiaceae bacterium]